jgi:hypothetical protein
MGMEIMEMAARRKNNWVLMELVKKRRVKANIIRIIRA